MSWKAGVKRIPSDDKAELARQSYARRDAMDSAIYRIKNYKEIQQEEKIHLEQETHNLKNRERDRYWKHEKLKTEGEIRKKSSASLLRDVLSCNVEVEHLLGGECEAKWKELSTVASNVEVNDHLNRMAQVRAYAPQSMVANHFLATTLRATDPLMLDHMLQTPYSDLLTMSDRDRQPLISPRAKLLSRIQNAASVPGTPMVVRSGPTPVTKRLIDSVFLAGPKKSDIMDLLSGQAPDLTPTTIYPVAVGRSDPSSRKKTPEPAPGKRPSSLRLSGEGAVVGGNISGYALAPEMLYLTSQDPDVITDALPLFCFPNGVETTVTDVFAGNIPTSTLGNTMPSSIDGPNAVETIKPKYFVFQLNGNTRTQYGVCMRFSRRFGDKVPFSPIVYTSYCICLVSSNPLFLFLFDVLAAFLNTDGLDFSEPISGGDDGLLVPSCLKHLDDFAMKLLRQSVPQYDKQLLYAVTVKGMTEEILLQRRQKNDLSVGVLDTPDGIGAVEGNYLTLEWALPVLLAHVPLKEILFVLGCMLTEMKVVVKCKDIGVLSACVMGLLCLMRPLSWSCPYIVILPESLRDYLESPVPVVIGVVTTPETESADFLLPTPGAIVIDVNLKKVNLDPADVVYSHTLKLPHTDALLPKLRPHTEIISNVTRQRRRNNEPKVPDAPPPPPKESGVTAGQFIQPSSPTSRRKSLAVPPLPLTAMLANEPSSPRSYLQRRSLSQIPASDTTQLFDGPRRRQSTGSSAVAAQILMRRYSTDSFDSPRDGQSKRGPQVGLKSPQGSTSSERLGLRGSPALSELSMDGANEEGTEAPPPDLSSAVIGFSNCLAAHMTQIADTAIKMSWDNKAQRRQARHDLRNAPRERASSDASICSSDVSYSVIPEDALPTAHSNRTTFRKVGNAVLSFIKKFKDTQIFSQYCQLEREKQAIAEGKINDQDNGSLSNTPRGEYGTPDTIGNNTDGARADDVEAARGANNEINGTLSISTDAVDLSPAEKKYRNNTVEQGEKDRIDDPVLALFSIMVSGSIPLPQSELGSLANIIERVYVEGEEEIGTPGDSNGPADEISGDSYRNGKAAKNGMKSIASPAAHPSSWNPFVSPPPPLVRATFKADINKEEIKKPKRLTPEMFKVARDMLEQSTNPVSSKDSPRMEVTEDTLFCNGRCGGRVDTPLCTEICCQVWQEKAEEVQKLMEARQIILDLRGRTSAAATTISTGNGRVVKIPPLPSMKQIRETNSQFEKRLKLINKGSAEVNTSLGSKMMKSKTWNRPEQRNRSPDRPAMGIAKVSTAKATAEEVVPGKKRLNTASSSSKAIARYYKAVEKRRLNRKRADAASVICRHIYACVQSSRLARLMHSIVSVQAVVRGFLVRCNFVLLSDLLRQRNFMFKVARRKFKRWLKATVSVRRQRPTSSAREMFSSANVGIVANTSTEVISKPTPIPTAPTRALSPVGSRFSDLTSAVANALGGNNRRSPKADIPLVPKSSSSPGADAGGMNYEQSIASEGGLDPFSKIAANTTKRSGSMHSTSTGGGNDDAAVFKVLREGQSVVSDFSNASEQGGDVTPDSDDNNMSVKAKFKKNHNLTVTTLHGDQYQGINSTLLNSKSYASVSTPSETGRRSPSNMSQYSTASVSSVMDDVLKIKQRLSSGTASKSRNVSPRIMPSIDGARPDPIPEILSKVAISPKNGRGNLFRANNRDSNEKSGSSCGAEHKSSSSGSDQVSYNYFEHVDLDAQEDGLSNDPNGSNSDGENKWSTDALGNDSNSAFRKQNHKKSSPLTRLSGQGVKNAGMTSIPEAEGDSESVSSNTPREQTVPLCKSPVSSGNRKKTSSESSAESKEGSPSGSGKKVSSQMKSLQDTLEEVLKSEIDHQKQWEEVGSGSMSVTGIAGNRGAARTTTVTNTVSAKSVQFSNSKKLPRKRPLPGQINVESLTSISEADARFESIGRYSEGSVPAAKSSGHYRISSDVSISAMSDDSSGYNAASSPLPAPVAEALGATQVKELLTVQQQRSIRTLYDLLRRGVNVMKHGRSGKPKMRRLYCDESLSTLFWREADSYHGGRKSIEGGLASSSAEEDDGGAHENTAAEVEQRGTKRRRSSFMRFVNKDDSDRKISVGDIMEVTDDLSAEVMQRSISRQPYSLGPHQDIATCVISLVLRNRSRTYDFEIDEKSWNVLFHSLRILVNYFQVDAPGNANG